MTTTATNEVTPSGDRVYSSPQRCLLSAARKGRQRWKLKAQRRNRDLKVLKVRVCDLERSRQNHAQRAQEARADLSQAEQTIEQLRTELVQTQAALKKKK